MNVVNILLVGVGGQGILTTSGILARSALKAGLNVVTAETHGMAQRGGSVEVHVRIGDAESPLIPIGSAHYLIALEPSEALRYIQYANRNTTLLVNDRPIIPPSVSQGISSYPDIKKTYEKLKEYSERIELVPASKIAEDVAGTVQATNVVVLGMLSRIANLPFSYEIIESAMKDVLPEKLHEANIKALKAGYDYFS
ncbi:2-oxoacid:acceptor oxidoreductase family protein [Geoglobus acetivorans]|uniref:2-oxoacid:acceptor oxidoreductase family protein n=1 Tax=Geoglobus acetivorans TaxID=565033 RepID=UPI00064FCADF